MFARQVSRAAGRTFQSARKFSGDAAEARVEASKWIKVSAGMICLTGVAGFYNIAIHDHPHRGEVTYAYNNIRAKPFPWTECPDCPIFNGACWAACRGQATEEH